MYGPQITARPGTKRHLKQVRARISFLAVMEVYAKSDAKKAAAKAEAAQAQATADRAALEFAELMFLAITPTQGVA